MLLRIRLQLRHNKRNPEAEASQPKKKKHKKKSSKPTSIHTLSGDDINMIVRQVTLSIEDMIDNVSTMQRKNYADMSQQLTELRQFVMQLLATPSQRASQPEEKRNKTLEPTIHIVQA